jgi:hypothetical protein
VLTYSTDGQILTLTAVGTSTSEHRIATFMAIRRDPHVQPASLLLVNAQDTAERFDHQVLADLIALTIRTLGPKLAPVCAVIFPASYVVESRWYQTIAAEKGLRVGLFKDEPSARDWLSAYLPSAPST